MQIFVLGLAWAGKLVLEVQKHIDKDDSLHLSTTFKADFHYLLQFTL